MQKINSFLSMKTLRATIALSAIVFATLPAFAVEVSSGPVTFQQAVVTGVERSPELRRLQLAMRSAELLDPLLMSETDPRLEASYSKTIDESPRAAPAFEGTRSDLESFDVGLYQKTIIGTEASLIWANDRLINPSPFRALDPSAESRVTLNVRQNLVRYFWGRPDVARRSGYRSDVAAAAHRFRAAMAAEASLVANAYLTALFSSERAEIADRAVRASEQLLKSYEEKKRYGLVEESDVVQARVSLDSDRLERELAISDRVVAMNALRSRLGYEPTRLSSVTTPVPVPTTLDSAIARAMVSRPDFLAAESDFDAAEWRVRSRVLETLPELAVFGSYGTAGLDRDLSGAWDDLSGFDHLVRSAGVDLRMPFGFRRERLERAQARIERDQAAAEFERVRRDVEREVRDAWSAHEIRTRALADRESLLKLQERKLQAEDANFRRGRSTTDVIVRFRQDIHRAAFDLARARADAASARVELARASGMLLEAFGEEVGE